MITFKLNDQPVNIPTTWEDLTYGQYLQMAELKDDNIQLVSILTGLDYEKVKTAKISGLPQLFAALQGMKKTPEFKERTENIGPYKIGKMDPQMESLAQFEDMRSIINKTGKQDGPISVLYAHGALVGIYLQKIRDGHYSYEKAQEMLTEIKAMPAKEVITWGSFFWIDIINSSNGTPASSQTTAPNLKKKKRATAGYKKRSARSLRSRK